MSIEKFEPHRNTSHNKISSNQKSQKLIAAILTIVGIGAASMNVAADTTTDTDEKCYGIVRKGMNECGTPKHSCEGVSTADRDPEEWIYLPKGTCEKIAGGVTKKE